ncbi:hypothetical protein [Rhizohabitans arisaemae]|uniref:hypothetical protein n=1 Tax=Rhizohabitans arisaemae TaxID=2720610 RepID=UPI0024B2538C|nr:hypothetical protein [Rhizohabitans arisaemae]
MSDMIDRLRDAANAVGETLQPRDVPPLKLVVKRRPRRMLVMPIAVVVSAAAVASIVVATNVTVPENSVQEALSSQQPVFGAMPDTAGPRFFVETLDKGLGIRTADKGDATGSVPNPAADERFTQVQGASDNRTFYAVTSTPTCESGLYRLEVTQEGGVGSFSRLDLTLPKGTAVTSLAVSGDGGKLAYGLQSCQPSKQETRLVLADVATKSLRTWASPTFGDVYDVSMSSDARWIAFRSVPMAERESVAVVTDLPGQGADTGGDSGSVAAGQTSLFAPQVWVIDSSTKNNDLSKGRLVKLPTSFQKISGEVTGIRITPDGRSFVAAVGAAPTANTLSQPAPQQPKAADSSTTPSGLIEYSAQTGEPRRVVYQAPAGGSGGWDLVDADATGQRLLVRRNHEFGYVEGGVFHPLTESTATGIAW